MNNIKAIQFNVHNGWHDITVEKPKSHRNCIVYDSQQDSMWWLYYDDDSKMWVDARKGDFDIDINTSFTVSIVDKQHYYLRDEVHLRFKFWKYIKKAPRLTNPIKILK